MAREGAWDIVRGDPKWTPESLTWASSAWRRDDIGINCGVHPAGGVVPAGNLPLFYVQMPPLRGGARPWRHFRAASIDAATRLIDELYPAPWLADLPDGGPMDPIIP